MIDPNTITDEQADAAQIALYEYAFGFDAPAISARELGISRQGWKVAIAAALELIDDPVD